MTDWERLIANWQATLNAIERLGGAVARDAAHAAGIQHTDIWGLYTEPPATRAEVRSVEAAIGGPLPAALKELFLTDARRVEFCWQLPEDLMEKEPFPDIFRGGFSLSLDRIPDIQAEMQGMAAVFEDASEFDLTWQDKLTVMRGYPGDYYVFDRRDGITEEVLYLSHEDDAGHGYVLGTDFADFLRRWSALGCPGPEHWQWLPFTSGPTSLLQPDGTAARLWRKTIGLELPP